MMMGIFYDRIKPNTKNNNENWHCARCKKDYANGNKYLTTRVKNITKSLGGLPIVHFVTNNGHA